MEIRILGFSDINFTTDSGDRIDGVNIFCAYEDEYVTGYRTDKFFIKRKLVPVDGFKCDCYYDLLFDRRGKVGRINYIGDTVL